MRQQGLSYLLTRANQLVLLVLAVVVLLSVFWVVTTSRPAPVEPSREDLQPASFSSPEMSAAAEGFMVSQPLFWQSRRPYTPPELEVEGPLQSFEQGSILDSMTVTGLVGGGDNALVIVQLDDQRRRIRLNESVQGWELIDISANQATFRGRAGDGALEERTLPLQRHAVASEADPAIRARFAPAGSESSRVGVEAAEDREGREGMGGTTDGSSDELSESAEQPPASAESSEPVE